MIAVSSKAIRTPRRMVRREKADRMTKAEIAPQSRVPARHYCFTVKDYHRLGELGILKPDQRVELVEGEIVMMPPIDISHAQGTHLSQKKIGHKLDDVFDVRCQQPVDLGLISEPVPDISVVRQKRYTAHPTVADIALIVEVANTSLEDDLSRKKLMYAASGVREYWVLDVANRVLHVFSAPKRGNYSRHEIVAEDEAVQSPNLKPLRLKVSELLP
jgi:Uma2 family endonuclease